MSAAAVQRHDGFDDGKTQSRAFCRMGTCAVSPVEAVEDFRQMLLRDAAAAVGHTDFKRRVRLPNGKLDLAAARRMAQRIGKQVAQCAPQ